MPSEALVAKEPTGKRPSPTPPSAPEIEQNPEFDQKTTTWKSYQRTARILRKIQSHFDDYKQEDVLEMFNEAFENFLLELQAADAKRRRG